ILQLVKCALAERERNHKKHKLHMYTMCYLWFLLRSANSHLTSSVSTQEGMHEADKSFSWEHNRDNVRSRDHRDHRFWTNAYSDTRTNPRTGRWTGSTWRWWTRRTTRSRGRTRTREAGCVANCDGR